MKTTNYLAGLAAITMTFTGMAAPISAYADDISASSSVDYATYGNFVYIIKADKTADIVEYNGKEENVVIPAEVNGYTVTGISGWSGKPTSSHPLGAITGAFKNNKTIKTVVIPDTVKYIDDESFYGCTALESVMFGNGVEEIGDYAFENCTSLSKVYIPVSVKKIGAEAFGYTFGSELTLNKNFSMTCAKDSAAEKYAKENGITYDTYQVKINELAVSGIKDKEYTGKPVTQNIVIKNGNVVLVEQLYRENLGDESVKVYNFQVEDYHTYFVGLNTILVHNSNCRLIQNSDGSYDAELSYKEGWTPEQRAQADAKCKALSDAYTVKTNVAGKRNGTKTSRYRKDNAIPSNQDVDHTIDLQLGGQDNVINMNGLDKSVNRSLGKQINILIKNLHEGTVLGKFTMK